MLYFMQAIRKSLWDRGVAVRRIPTKDAENTGFILAFFCYGACV